MIIYLSDSNFFTCQAKTIRRSVRGLFFFFLFQVQRPEHDLVPSLRLFFSAHAQSKQVNMTRRETEQKNEIVHFTWRIFELEIWECICGQRLTEWPMFDFDFWPSVTIYTWWQMDLARFNWASVDINAYPKYHIIKSRIRQHDL